MKFKVLFMSFLLFVLAACGGSETTHPLSGELEKSNNFKEDFIEFKLPTELPFEVEQVEINNMEKQPSPLNKHELSVVLFGDEDYIEVHMLENISLESASGENEQLTELSDGREAKYFYNENSQILRWNDDDLFYGIIVYVDGVEKYTIEELVNIANSFEVYN